MLVDADNTDLVCSYSHGWTRVRMSVKVYVRLGDWTVSVVHSGSGSVPDEVTVDPVAVHLE